MKNLNNIMIDANNFAWVINFAYGKGDAYDADSR